MEECDVSVLPKANAEGVIGIEAGEIVIFKDKNGKERGRLDRLSALIWRLADGHTGVADISQAATEALGRPVDREAVWSALDRLADVELILERITPPAGQSSVSRRGIVRMAALASGALVASPAAAIIGFPSEKTPESELETELEKPTFQPTGPTGPGPGIEKEVKEQQGKPTSPTGPTQPPGPLPTGFPTLTIDKSPLPTGLPTVGPSPGPKCFITTACVAKAGLPDNCHELEALRALRRRHIQFVQDGPEFLLEYHQLSPEIVKRIDAAPNNEQIWESLLSDTRNVVALIDTFQDAEAFDECKEIYIRLRDNFCSGCLSL